MANATLGFFMLSAEREAQRAWTTHFLVVLQGPGMPRT
jgi:hypothetical protein